MEGIRDKRWNVQRREERKGEYGCVKGGRTMPIECGRESKDSSSCIGNWFMKRIIRLDRKKIRPQ